MTTKYLPAVRSATTPATFSATRMATFPATRPRDSRDVSVMVTNVIDGRRDFGVES